MDIFEHKLQLLVDQRSIVGLAFAIIQKGHIVYSKGLGVTGVEDYQLPVTPRTLFTIGSISKTVAAVTIMRLVEQGMLDLDQPILNYLKDYEFADRERGEDVTLRHLLSHSSGLPASGRNWGERGRNALRKFVWEDLRYHRFFAPPGKVHIYSNTAISCVGYVAEEVTQIPFDDLVQELVFQPLDMQRSTYSLAKAVTYPLALPHRLDTENQLHVIHRRSDNDMGHASGFCYCSTEDLAKFTQALLIPDTLLSEKSLTEMQTPTIDLHSVGANYPGALMNASYGLGLSIGDYRGVRIIRHGGMNQSYNCFMDIFPDKEVAVVLQTNYMQDESAVNILFELYDRLLQPIAPLRPVTPQHRHDMFSDNIILGEYMNPVNGLQTLSRVDNQLYLNEEFPLNCIGDSTYYYQSGSLRFPVKILENNMLSIRGIPYRLILQNDLMLDSTRWQDYVGMFIDPFTPYPMDTAIQVRVENEKLLINGVVKRALSNEQFISSSGLYEFLDSDTLQVHMATQYIRFNK